MSEYRNYEEDYIIESINYGKHASAMTGEQLHSKSDIAAELAYRDDRIEQLGRENAELAAHNERYRVFVENFCEKVPDTPETHWIYPSVQTLKRATRFTPQTSLAEVKAKAVEGAAMKLKQSMTEGGAAWLVRVEDLLMYAQQIRNEGSDQ